LLARVNEFLSNHHLLLCVFQPIFFRQTVVKKVCKISSATSPRLFLNLIKANIKGRSLGEEGRITTGVLFTLFLSLR
jgi:hypothetical protein